MHCKWLVLYRFDSLKGLGKPSKVFLFAVRCFGNDQSASDSPHKMTLTRLEFLLSLVSLANTRTILFPPHCGDNWWLGSDGRPVQNLHCGQLFQDPSSMQTTIIASPTSSSSPLTTDATQMCSEDEFLCGDGSTCFPFSKLCDEVDYRLSCKKDVCGRGNAPSYDNCCIELSRMYVCCLRYADWNCGIWLRLWWIIVAQRVLYLLLKWWILYFVR